MEDSPPCYIYDIDVAYTCISDSGVKLECPASTSPKFIFDSPSSEALNKIKNLCLTVKCAVSVTATFTGFDAHDPIIKVLWIIFSYVLCLTIHALICQRGIGCIYLTLR